MNPSSTGGAVAPRGLAPTLVVGLGGLGREVLFRTRRRLYERYRRTTLPVLSFLWLDHDTDIDPTPELPARVARKVALVPSERVTLSLRPDELARLGVGQGGGVEPRSRKLGAATLSARADSLAVTLDEAVARARSAEAREHTERLGFEVERDRLEVLLVTSLAGGLGSGALLPLARLIRARFPGAHVRAVLFLSGLFMAHDVKRRRLSMANGYAAVREILAAQSAESPSPLDAIYVIDRENLEGNRPIDPLEPLEMVSQSLALEFSRSNCASALRGVRYEAHTGAALASFGMAAVAPGGGRLRSAAAYLLGAEILESWVRGEARPDAVACGLPQGWPEEAIAAAAADLREEYETYDIPPVEERNQALPAPEDLRPLLFEHLGEELELPAADERAILAALGARFQEHSAQTIQAFPRPGGEPWERLMDRLERFSLRACARFDARIAQGGSGIGAELRVRTIAAMRSWSEPWAPLHDGIADERSFRTVLGTGMSAEAPLVTALGAGSVHTYHPGTVVRYRETPPLPAAAFPTIEACQAEYSLYEALAGDRLVHRHTVLDFESLPGL